MSDQSQYDPSRKTVGAIYRDAAVNNKLQEVEAGDLSRELAKSLVEDLNEAVKSNPFDGRPFYITVWERKDLQMQRAIKRSLYKSLYRPWPEDDTVVYYVNPKKSLVKFCWCLPHWTDMDNVLMNPGLYAKEYVADIKAWKNFHLEHFGFSSDKKAFWAIDREDVDSEKTQIRSDWVKSNQKNA